MQITIRPASLTDEELVLDLLEQLFDPPGGPPPDYTRERGSLGLRWAIEQDHADVLLAFDGARLVGMASVYADIESIRFGHRCWLQDLVVEKAVRSSGVGKTLLDAASAWAREHGCTHLELASGMGRTDAHRFYEREGMTGSMNYYKWLD
ncbi:MAG TPA: GNAT family N-acetyltransferase [Dehalococcoidia bacterium]|nr:GNAT family N-acetyltransferase [Dehalococcoidia bacterium]